MPLAIALRRFEKLVDGKPSKAKIKLPGKRGTGTAKDARGNSMKKTRNTGPPRILLFPF